MQELAEARAIVDRIRTRNLYRCVDHKSIKWEFRDVFQRHVTPEHIVQAVQGSTTYPMDTIVLPHAASLQVSDVIVCFSTMHYGMKERNVLDFVKFYSKHKPNGELFAIPFDVHQTDALQKV